MTDVQKIRNELEKSAGIYRKYYVKRLHDKAGKHKNCFFFVLDFNHDKFAIPALKAYAKACRKEYPNLAQEILCKIEMKELDESITRKNRECGR